MRSPLKYSGTLAIIAVCVLSACGNSDSSSDTTGTRTKNAVLAPANPEMNVDNVDAVVTKQIVTTTVAPSTTTTVVESQASSNAVAATTTIASEMSSSSATTVAPDNATKEVTPDTMATTDEEIATKASDTTVTATNDIDAMESKSAPLADDADDSSNSLVLPIVLVLIVGVGGLFAYRRKKK